MQSNVLAAGRTPRALLLTLTLGLASAGHAPAHAEDPRDAEVTFTRTDGLSSAGATVLSWLEQASWHGLDLAVDPLIPAWVARAGHDYHLADQLVVEAALRDGLTQLVAGLPARPRTEPVLEDAKRNYYLSPDVTWRAATVPAAAPEAIVTALAAARAGTLDEHLRALAPQHPQYTRLVAASQRYAGICAAGEWAPIVLPKNPKQVATSELATAFQARLAREGFYAGAPSGQWDDATTAALAGFRATRQVPDKGAADPVLVAALNVPCADLMKVLALNAKRWRVTGWSGERTWVEVNLAAQEVRYFVDGRVVFAERTVVGSNAWMFDAALERRRYFNATPILMDHIAKIVLNPTWSVPPRIAVNEISTAIAADPSYLDAHHFVAVPTSNGGTTYVQRPGPWNALGQIKILFPNAESVYLHDTPKKAAFKNSVRASSHGCVRVQNAVDLGMALLSGDAATAGTAFDEARVRAQLASGNMVQYDLAHPVPVFLEYYTASVDDAGTVRFHPDIYTYDDETFTGRPTGRRPSSRPSSG